MSDLELSKALALAIGWTESDLVHYEGQDYIGIKTKVIGPVIRIFSYKFPEVIWRIAERRGIFPHPLVSGNLRAKGPEIVGWECFGWHYGKKRWVHHTAPTAAMACALTVIAISEPKP